MADELVERLRRAGCVFAEDEAEVLREAAQGGRSLSSMVDERVGGVPLEHVVGWVDFAGVRVPIDRGVFVPRPRSEFLVDIAAGLLRPGQRLLDLCCGSGALAVAVGSRVPVDVLATDNDSRAVANARRALAPWGGEVYEGDLFEALPEYVRSAVDVVVVVAPYVPRDAIDLLPHEARDFEPRGALDGGGDGLDVLRRVAAQVDAWLRPGGWILAEIAEEQAPVLAAVFESRGMRTAVHERDGAIVLSARRDAGDAGDVTG